MFPVRYELNSYINFLRNSVFKGLIVLCNVDSSNHKMANKASNSSLFRPRGKVFPLQIVTVLLLTLKLSSPPPPFFYCICYAVSSVLLVVLAPLCCRGWKNCHPVRSPPSYWLNPSKLVVLSYIHCKCFLPSDWDGGDLNSPPSVLSSCR
jgi:hypothetical protein